MPAPKPYTGKPSLSEALERITRAGENLEELRRAIEPLQFKPKGTTTLIQSNLGPGKPVAVLVFSPPQIPIRVGVLIGEVCYNLRASMDYLVFHLSALDSGLDHQGTQFPIENKPKEFAYRVDVRGILGGMNASHRALIEGLQPYKGCDWTKTLKDISNPDKHRNLTPVQIEGTPSTRRIVDGPLSELGDVGGTVMSAKFPDGTEMHADVHVTTLILFSDGIPVIKTLEELKAQVSKTLEAFEPEFK